MVSGAGTVWSQKETDLRTLLMTGYDKLSRPDQSIDVLLGLHLISMNYLVSKKLSYWLDSIENIFYGMFSLVYLALRGFFYVVHIGKTFQKLVCIKRKLFKLRFRGTTFIQMLT